MPSLKGEALSLQQQQDDWYVSDTLKKRTTSSQITTDKQVKRTRIAESSPDHRGKRKVFYDIDTDNDTDDDDDDDDAVVERSEKKAKLVSAGAKGDCSKRGSRLNMEDKDYVDFLAMLSANQDFYGKSGDYCLDFPRKDPVDCGGFEKPSEDDDPVEIVDCGGSEKLSEDDVDPHYKIFLENARVDGSSYGFEMTKGDGTKVFLRYEEMEDSPYGDIGIDDEDQLDDTPCEEFRNDSTVKTTPKIEPVDDGFEKANGPVGENPSLAAPHWFLSHCKPGTISSADKSYLKFLDHVWVEGDSFTYKNGDNIVKYDTDDNVVTSPKELVRKVTSPGNRMKFSPDWNQQRTSKTAVHDGDGDKSLPSHQEQAKNIISSGDKMKFRPNTDQKRTSNAAVHDDDDDDSDSNSVQILDEEIVKSHYGPGKSFIKKLREILEMPFDKRELKEKYREANLCKPMEKSKIMRGREKDYRIEQKRTSFLGRHSNLAKMLNDALQEPDQRRALALLRCLFYYYEYCSHEKSFYPWQKPMGQRPIGWLHNILCRCPDPDDVNCPMRNYKKAKGGV